jgi:hypothetical protein
LPRQSDFWQLRRHADRIAAVDAGPGTLARRADDLAVRWRAARSRLVCANNLDTVAAYLGALRRAPCR